MKVPLSDNYPNFGPVYISVLIDSQGLKELVETFIMEKELIYFFISM